MDRTKRYFLTTKYNTSTPLIFKKFISISLFVIFPLKISFRTFPPPFPFLFHPAFALSFAVSLSRSLSLSLSHSLSLSSISSSSILFLVANSRSVCFSTVAQSTVPPTSLASRRFSVFFLAADMPACCFARSPSPSCPFSLFSMHRQQRRGNRVFATHSRGARVQGEWHVHGASLTTS